MTMADPPPFDPTKPFQPIPTAAPAAAAGTPPPFDPAKPFTPAPAAAAPTPSGGTREDHKGGGPSTLARLWHGFVSPFYGEAQTGARMPAAGEGTPAEAFGGTSPDYRKEVDTATQKFEGDYQTKRKEGGQLGTDWVRLLGGALGTVAAMPVPVPGGSIAGGIARKALIGGARGAVMGGAGGALEPVTEGEPGSDAGFLAEKRRQLATGAVTGGALGGAGTPIAGAIAPHMSAAAQKLRAGIPGVPGTGVRNLTLGQMRGTERPTPGLDSFNIATVNHVLSDIGESLPEGTAAGVPANKAAHTLVSDFYKKTLAQIPHVEFDGELDTAFDAIKKKALRNPEVFKRVQGSLDEVLEEMDSPLNGKAFQKLASSLGNRAYRAMKPTNTPEGTEAGELVNELRQKLLDAAERQHPAVGPDLRRANKSYEKLKVWQRAAARRVDSDNKPTPSDLLTASRQHSGTDKFSRGAGTLQDWAATAGRVLPKSGADKPSAAMGHIAHFIRHPILSTGAAALGALPHSELGSRAAERYLNPGSVRSGLRFGAEEAVPRATRPAGAVAAREEAPKKRPAMEWKMSPKAPGNLP